MKPFPIPVTAFGPGSQPTEDDEITGLDMPREVDVFSMPLVPDVTDRVAATECRDVLMRLLTELTAWNPEGSDPGPVTSLMGVAPAALDLVNQMMGEGEVGIRIVAGRDVRIQESIFTGLWRVREFNPEGALIADHVEAACIPAAVLSTAREATLAEMPEQVLPPEAMNSPAILTELRAQMAEWQPGKPAHVINLTLLPMSPIDLKVIDVALGSGPLAMISRGFGNCHISATTLRHVWRVQYFNSMKTMILNTVVVTDMPEEAIAAPEDLHDTTQRLAELIDWIEQAWEV
ncbi:MAG: hydrogenase expression/formation C-terminal domain-containing protein [Burkholderiaceae bacterium]